MVYPLLKTAFVKSAIGNAATAAILDVLFQVETNASHFAKYAILSQLGNIFFFKNR